MIGIPGTKFKPNGGDMSKRLYKVMSFIGLFVLYVAIFLLALMMLASAFTGQFMPYHSWDEPIRVIITSGSMICSFGLTLYTVCD